MDNIYYEQPITYNSQIYGVSRSIDWTSIIVVGIVLILVLIALFVALEANQTINRLDIPTKGVSRVGIGSDHTTNNQTPT